MKFVVVALAVLSSTVFADGIPVPMEQQTPYNWKCAYSEDFRTVGKLHLMLEEGLKPTLYMNLSGVVGVQIPASVARALRAQKYSALHGKTFVDSQFKRSVTFTVTGKALSVKLQDGSYKMVTTECRAQFKAQP